jgi:hypothetical protein
MNAGRDSIRWKAFNTAEMAMGTPGAISSVALAIIYLADVLANNKEEVR